MTRQQWVTGKKLIERWGIKAFELFDFLKQGLQPYTGHGTKIVDSDSLERAPRDSLETIEKNERTKAHVPRVLGSPGSSSRPPMTEWEIKQRARQKYESQSRKPVVPEDCVAMSFTLPLDEIEANRMIARGMDFLFKMDEAQQFEQKHNLYQSSEEASENNISQIDKPEKPSQVTLYKNNTIPIISFYKNGQKWMIGEKGKEKIFNNLIGYKLIHFLIEHKEEVFNPLKVYYCGNVPQELRYLLYETDYQKYSDKKTIGMVIKHKKEKKEELIETIDPQRKEDIEAEIEQCEKFLKKARRGLGSKQGQCRINVRKLIKRAIKTIYEEAERSPSLKTLKQYLKLDGSTKTIKTGTMCCYKQDPSNPVQWLLYPDE